MTVTIVIETIIFLLDTMGTIGLMLGLYKILLKNEEKSGKHICAYAFFICACSDALQSSYIMMIISEVVAIKYFTEYVYGERDRLF